MKTYSEPDIVSECCGGNKQGDSDICPMCYEHADWVEESTYWLNRPEPAQYSYAPSQRQLRTWIARVCFGRI